MISASNLSKAFFGKKAVDDLSFEISTGEIVGFLGPNGAGKTTTMRMLAGYLTPDAGSVMINGIPLLASPIEAKRHIGYLPENNPLYKDMLVAELLALSADLKRIPKAQRKDAFDFSVNAVGISSVFYRPIGELSKGFKQRVGIALALLHRPNVLLLDEPTEGLDPNQRTEMRALIKELARSRTVLMSTHVMQEASAIASRILIVHRGKLIADGTPEALSQAAKKERVLLADIEGEGAELALRTLAGVTHTDIESVAPHRHRARLAAAEGVPLQPELSRIAREKNWTIWALAEETHTLEDVFHELTNET